MPARTYNADAGIKGVLIQQMAQPSREVILCANRYPVFDPLIMFGFGGIFVEVFKDVAFRGQPVCDEVTIERCLVSLSDAQVILHDSRCKCYCYLCALPAD